MVLETIDTARLVVDAIAGKMGADILLLDLTAITIIADYFVIATGESERQLEAMSGEVLRQLEKNDGATPLAVEGTPESGWLLIDYGSVVVHLFSQMQRARYQLEGLWHNAHTIVRMA